MKYRQRKMFTKYRYLNMVIIVSQSVIKSWNTISAKPLLCLQIYCTTCVLLNV